MQAKQWCNSMIKNKIQIICIMLFACLCMGLVDAVIQPGYLEKSVIKAILFLLPPIIYSKINKQWHIADLFRLKYHGLIFASSCGIVIYLLIVGAFLLLRNVFDFSALTGSLSSTTGVNKDNFLLVALYISFCNSLLEELFFRGFGFLTLKRVASRSFAYLFSAALFALYHIAMMIGWFDLPIIILSLVGLFAGGLIFNYFNERWSILYPSWVIHMFANFATNTIGAILFYS